MDKLTELTQLRRRYLELTRLFFIELHKGRPLQDLSGLKESIDTVLEEINRLETELNLLNDKGVLDQ